MSHLSSPKAIILGGILNSFYSTVIIFMFIDLCVFVFMSMCGCTCHSILVEVSRELVGFSPSIMWVLGIKLKSEVGQEVLLPPEHLVGRV